MTKFPRSPRRLDIIFPRNPLYFVTFCTYRRRLYLANDYVHASFIKFAQRAQIDFGIAVGRYVILPDHLHLGFSREPSKLLILAIRSGNADSSIIF